VMVPPGKVAQTPLMSGHFDKSTHAVLRVYRGDLRMAEILAVSRGSPNRVDWILEHTGDNNLRVSDEGGLMKVQETAPGH
jgi:hypothetical protein